MSRIQDARIDIDLSQIRLHRNNVEITCISFNNLWYTFDKSVEKIDIRVLLSSNHILASLNLFFLKLSMDHLPVVRAKQLCRLIDEEGDGVTRR